MKRNKEFNLCQVSPFSFHHFDKTSEKINLKEESFILAHISEISVHGLATLLLGL
jgi:hypothetical protein